MNHNHDFLNLVHEAKQRIKEITIDDLQQKIDQKESFILLDVRENDEWANGRIPEAMHLPRGILERDVEALISDKKIEVVVYCGGGYRSALACDALQKMGYLSAFSLAGGIRAWFEAGKPIEQ